MSDFRNEVDEDKARSKVGILFTKGPEGEPGSLAIVVRSDAPLSLFRCPPGSDRIGIKTEMDDANPDDGFVMTLTEDLARRLAIELVTMLFDPEHPGFRR